MPLRLKEGFAYNSHDVVAIYEGSGYLTMENGARMACEFRADQDCKGLVQVLCHRILPTDFAFHLIPLMETGASAGFSRHNFDSRDRRHGPGTWRKAVDS